MQSTDAKDVQHQANILQQCKANEYDYPGHNVNTMCEIFDMSKAAGTTFWKNLSIDANKNAIWTAPADFAVLYDETC